ncbi:MAG TPA: hypothetical protein PKC40_05325 [Saprospiraceae bacterium]|nr:hypothetical protein [Saprospiraceae bacterium]
MKKTIVIVLGATLVVFFFFKEFFSDTISISRKLTNSSDSTIWIDLFPESGKRSVLVNPGETKSFGYSAQNYSDGCCFCGDTKVIAKIYSNDSKKFKLDYTNDDGWDIELEEKSREPIQLKLFGKIFKIETGAKFYEKTCRLTIKNEDL